VSQERRNLQLVDKWAELYNKTGSRFVSECYVEDVVVDIPGVLLIKGRDTFVAIEDSVCAAAPKRWVRIDRKIAQGDVVAVQATWFNPDQGDDFQLRFCTVLTFNDNGLIINDTAYLNTAPPKTVETQLTAADWREEVINGFAAWKEHTSGDPPVVPQVRPDRR
jgi:predicted SnoaL-like aldol condensation-catalyzing enzyme